MIDVKVKHVKITFISDSVCSYLSLLPLADFLIAEKKLVIFVATEVRSFLVLASSLLLASPFSGSFESSSLGAPSSVSFVSDLVAGCSALSVSLL